MIDLSGLSIMVKEWDTAWLSCDGLRAWLLPDRSFWLWFPLWWHGGVSDLRFSNGSGEKHKPLVDA